MSKSKRTYFTLKELVSFGNYVLSDNRKANMISIRQDQNSDDMNISQVYDADIANWKLLNTK